MQPDPATITWAELQDLFDEEPPAGPLFEVSPSVEKGNLIDRVLIEGEDAAMTDAPGNRMGPANAELVAKLNAAGHQLQLNEKGGIDWLALDVDFCNGPKCVRCHEVWCEHCEARHPSEIEPCQPDISNAGDGRE